MASITDPTTNPTDPTTNPTDPTTNPNITNPAIQAIKILAK